MKRAFVLRLTQEAQPVGGKFEGCVEEVDSGKSQRFASVEEFLSFLQRCLDDHKYGDLVQSLGSSTGITDHKCAEQEHEKLRQLETELAHINRVSMLGEMAASLAHEIKQPIAAAITCANSCIEWLAHEPPNIERALATATRIDRYGKRAAEIIDRIRSFYRKSPPQRELVDVNGIIHEMLTLLKGEAMPSSITMHTDLSAELPKIMVDRVQLQQVFMNLVLNAIEAMKDSGGELTVKSQLQDGQLQFSVSDTGVGLPMEKMDQIFSAFFTTKPQGSGMGLAISRSIVESHGGRLLGGCQRWTRSNISLHPTDPGHGVIALGCLRPNLCTGFELRSENWGETPFGDPGNPVVKQQLTAPAPGVTGAKNLARLLLIRQELSDKFLEREAMKFAAS